MAITGVQKQRFLKEYELKSNKHRRACFVRKSKFLNQSCQP